PAPLIQPAHRGLYPARDLLVEVRRKVRLHGLAKGTKNGPVHIQRRVDGRPAERGPQPLLFRETGFRLKIFIQQCFYLFHSISSCTIVFFTAVRARCRYTLTWSRL